MNRVRGQDYFSDCEHINPRQCHAIIGGDGRPRHRYRMWHIEGSDGQPTDDGPWYSAAEARARLDGAR